MSSFVKAARREQEVKWAWIWFKQFSSFHRHRGESTWEFSASHVIQFLQSKRDASVPAWRRMRIIEGLIMFRGEIQHRSSEDMVQPLERWVASREVLHQHDLAEGTASVWLPYALSRKYPTAHQELRWQFLFASDRLSRDPRTGRLHRHHLHKDTFPKRLRHAVDAAGLHKRVTSHTFRHCFASHLLWQGTDIRTIQHLLGHSDVATTEIYTHVRNPHESKVISPLDRLQAVA